MARVSSADFIRPYPDTGGIEPAVAVWAGVVAAALLWDVWLIRHGHRSLSTVAGNTRLGRVLVVALAAHLLIRLPGDPLRLVADRLRKDLPL